MGTRLLFGTVGAVSAVLMALGVNALLSASALDRAMQDTPSLLFRHDPEIVKRLRSAGAQFGDPQFSLMWNNGNDLDLHVIEPTGAHISYLNRRSPSGGELDVDANADPLRRTNRPVENIYWPPDNAPQGVYEVYVHHYANHGDPDPTPYTLRIVIRGRVKECTGALSHREESERVRVNPAGLEGWQPLVSGSSWWHPFLMVSGWGAVLGAVLALVLRVSQRWFGVDRAEFQMGRVVRSMFGALVLGAWAGLVSQAGFALLFWWSEGVARAVGFALLGGFLGYGLAHCVPNLPVNLARWAGILGGVVASLVFGWALQNATDASGCWPSTGVLGLAIGLAITLLRVRITHTVVRTGGHLTPQRLTEQYRVEVND